MRVNSHVFFNQEFNGVQLCRTYSSEVVCSSSSRGRKFKFAKNKKKQNKTRVNFHVFMNEEFNGASFSFLEATVQKWIRDLPGKKIQVHQKEKQTNEGQFPDIFSIH
uniref:Uncharacterized protein n=1 Tax=Cacopsylla melanoneura TaxID=428564 RepID=A0A8D9EDL6_9HEMI